MTAHDYARSLADKGTPLSAISRATGLSMQDIGYLRPRERATYSRPEPKPEPPAMPVFTAPVVNLKTPRQQVLEQSCIDHGITVQDAKEQTRKRQFAHPRQGVMFDLYTKCPQLSLPEIGRMLGGRDHTTILYGIKTHAARIGVRYSDIVKLRNAAKGKLSNDSIEAVVSDYAWTMERAL